MGLFEDTFEPLQLFLVGQGLLLVVDGPFQSVEITGNVVPCLLAESLQPRLELGDVAPRRRALALGAIRSLEGA